MASQPVDFESMVHGLARRQRVYVREWYQRIDAPSMNEATPAQMTWMRARHYPMPKDIARADSMTDEELKAAASSGDTKAQILYVARLLDEFSHTFTRGTPAAKYPFRLASEVDQMMPQILASGSPFAGYLYATRERILFPGNVEGNAALQLAGLVWASKFGDTRAKTLMDSATMQAVDPGTAVAAVELMIVKFMYANPRLLSTPVTPIPGRNR